MVNYIIRQKIVTVPEIELLEGSQIVSITHHNKYEDHRFDPTEVIREHWVVVWLEPHL